MNRKPGRLVWFHAASNGEALSALPLIHAVRELPSAPLILVTTMTVTAAHLIARHLPDDDCIHQFIPYDRPEWIDRFHAHWRPDMAVWMESELWPHHLQALKARGIPAILANARLSDKSRARWHYARKSFAAITSCFDTVLAQTPRDLDNLRKLGLNRAQYAGNLKDIALPLPYDPHAYEDMNLSLGDRPRLLYASTHPGEEAMAARIHAALKPEYPDLLTVIVPRHPARGNDIAAEIANRMPGLAVARRSLKMSPRPQTDIYVADTLGELGLFYRLCPNVFVGNSMFVKPGGGHNLLEPALLSCAVATGPDLHNFSVLAIEMPPAGACTVAGDEDALRALFARWLADPEQSREAGEKAAVFAAQKQATGIEAFLEPCKTVFDKAHLI